VRHPCYCNHPLLSPPPHMHEFEAENFTMSSGKAGDNATWEARAWAHSPGYFAANQANAFMSRRAYLHADANATAGAGAASATVRIAKAGVYNVLLRYEALYRFEVSATCRSCARARAQCQRTPPLTSACRTSACCVPRAAGPLTWACGRVCARAADARGGNGVAGRQAAVLARVRVAVVAQGVGLPVRRVDCGSRSAKKRPLPVPPAQAPAVAYFSTVGTRAGQWWLADGASQEEAGRAAVRESCWGRALPDTRPCNRSTHHNPNRPLA